MPRKGKMKKISKSKRSRRSTLRKLGKNKVKRRSLTGKILCQPEFFIPSFTRSTSSKKKTRVSAYCRIRKNSSKKQKIGKNTNIAKNLSKRKRRKTKRNRPKTK